MSTAAPDPGGEGLSEYEVRLWRTWWQLRKRMDTVLEHDFQLSAAISGSDFAVLVALSEAPGAALRARDLGRGLEWERSRVSHHLRRMERRGLITRRPTAEDGRGVVAALTPDGWRVLAKAASSHARLVRAMVFDPLDGEDLAEVDRLFSTVLASMSQFGPYGQRY